MAEAALTYTAFFNWDTLHRDCLGVSWLCGIIRRGDVETIQAVRTGLYNNYVHVLIGQDALGALFGDRLEAEMPHCHVSVSGSSIEVDPHTRIMFRGPGSKIGLESGKGVGLRIHVEGRNPADTLWEEIYNETIEAQVCLVTLPALQSRKHERSYLVLHENDMESCTLGLRDESSDHMQVIVDVANDPLRIFAEDILRSLGAKDHSTDELIRARWALERAQNHLRAWYEADLRAAQGNVPHLPNTTRINDRIAVWCRQVAKLQEDVERLSGGKTDEQ